jgi:hypothetical protein
LAGADLAVLAARAIREEKNIGMLVAEIQGSDSEAWRVTATAPKSVVTGEGSDDGRRS